MSLRAQPACSRGKAAPSLQKADRARYRHRWRHLMVRCSTKQFLILQTWTKQIHRCGLNGLPGIQIHVNLKFLTHNNSCFVCYFKHTFFKRQETDFWFCFLFMSWGGVDISVSAARRTVRVCPGCGPDAVHTSGWDILLWCVLPPTTSLSCQQMGN